MVETLRSEGRLRNLAWIESNRQRVAKATNGRVGYVYVPSTGIDGQNDLARMFYGQASMDALIIDERFNSGGQIPDRFVELLNRPVANYWAVRDGQDWQWPQVAHQGLEAGVARRTGRVARRAACSCDPVRTDSGRRARRCGSARRKRRAAAGTSAPACSDPEPCTPGC